MPFNPKRSLKSTLKGLFYLVLLTIIATTTIIKLSGDDSYKSPLSSNIVNDITQLNPIKVNQVITPTTVDQITSAIKNSSGTVSIGGGRYSMGGQTASSDSLHIDMRKFNKIINIDEKNKLLTVQTGATWRDIQEAIDPYDLSVKIMQTYANFTVGGSLSVNVHGRYIGEGPLISSVNSIQIVLADGSLHTASPDENPDLFYSAIGGYGGVGVITQTTIQLADNTRIERITTPLTVSEYQSHFYNNIRDNNDVIFHNADIYPPDYKDVLDVSWYVTDKPLTHTDRIIPKNEEYYWGPLTAEFVADYDFAKTIRKNIIDPLYYASNRIVWRNWEASYDVREIEPESRKETTYVLREYFIPVAHLEAFIGKMRDIFQANDVNVLNVSIRHAHKDPGSLLAWAREESFAFVVYYRQGTDKESINEVEKWSKEMIDTVISFNGSYYLPYQIFATAEQFSRAYPRSSEFFKIKDQYDPDNRFTNQLWNHHYLVDNKEQKIKSTTKDYYRGEEQTFLTIPEWYLVFNPVEYADFLETGNNPSDFPFMKSINEYWALYDRVTTISKDLYPDNSEYMTMLQVIGVSTTVEYMLKSLYENTLGRFTRWTASGQVTDEDIIIQQAARDYSDFIFDVAWYEFEFTSWIRRIWTETDFFGPNFIRKFERKIFFTLEYGFKSFYAKLIKFGAKTNYEQSDGLIYACIQKQGLPAAELPDNVKVIGEADDKLIISIPRWGQFTEAVKEMSGKGVSFLDIAGNSKISLTLISQDSQDPLLDSMTHLFTSKVVSDQKKQRTAVLVDVINLSSTIKTLIANNYKVEHVYDY